MLKKCKLQNEGCLFLKQKCAKEYAWYQEQQEAIEKNGYTDEVIEGMAEAAKEFLAGFGIKKLFDYLTDNPFVGHQYARSHYKAAVEEWKRHSPKSLREKAKSEVERLFELKIDQRCCELSSELL